MKILLSMNRFKPYFFLLWLLPLYATAQELVEIHDNFIGISLANHLTFEADYLQNQSFEKIQKSFNGKPIENDYPNFGDSPYPHWVRFDIKNIGKINQLLSLVTKGVDSLEVYVINQSGQIANHVVSGSHFPMAIRETPSPFLVTTFVLPSGATHRVWVRIRNVHYRLAASPFTLYEQSAAKKYLTQQHFFHSLFIGCMFLFLLLGIVLAYAFKEKIYWYYLGCIVCAFSIMIVYNDFLYVLVDTLPVVVLNKNILGILSATVPVFYLLFAEKFLNINRHTFAKIISTSRVIILIQYVVMLGLLVWGRTLFEYKLIFYIFMGALSSINLAYLMKSWPSIQAKLFVFATMPVTITVLFETLSGIHNIPVQTIHNAYYLTTFIELLVLTAGLVYNFKQNEEEKYKLENDLLNVGFEAQRDTRNQISEEMHGEIGPSLVAAKSQLAILSKNIPQIKWQELESNLDKIYVRVRELSHQLRLDDGYQIDSFLIQKYKPIEMVEFNFKGLEGVYFDEKIKVLLVTIVSEIITNALKYSQCNYIIVDINYQQPTLTIFVEDDGIGFDPKKSMEKGQGLPTIQKRVTRNLKGSCIIDSGPKGTTIIIKAKIQPL
jgi:signal transduction histidine kinase